MTTAAFRLCYANGGCNPIKWADGKPPLCYGCWCVNPELIVPIVYNAGDIFTLSGPARIEWLSPVLVY